MNYENLTSADLDFLISVVGKEYVSTRDADLDQHSKDESFHQAVRPSVVVWTQSAAEISAVLKYANDHHIPVTPWGAGTSLEGNPIPIFGGIVLDTSRMDKVIQLRADDFQIDVQPGLRYKEMNATLAKQGLFFPPDPGANASIGGMIANNAAGTRTLRYGTTKDNVLRLEVVLPSGEIIRTGTRAKKTSSGFDLVHLFIGSEGTLGIITEATLRLSPLPEKFSAAITSFSTTEAATQVVTNIIGSGIVPAALEFLDTATVRAISATGEFALGENPTLLMEFHSATDVALKEELNQVEIMCRDGGCLNFEAGLGRDERDRLWRARHRAYDILVRSRPGVAYLIVDVAVPISEYSRLVSAAQAALAEQGLQGYLVGHAGDGNLHPLVPYTPGDTASYTTAWAADEKIVEAAIAMGGTATGEHGVGIGKRRFMPLEHGASLNAMRAIKATFDPNGILNPGKIFESD
ncbi:MAG: FAD-binding oxidoreductase [Chloroflexi bacterium]|nr:FAD-binding oxidoreductase [Chloroflexota bacterium]